MYRVQATFLRSLPLSSAPPFPTTRLLPHSCLNRSQSPSPALRLHLSRPPPAWYRAPSATLCLQLSHPPTWMLMRAPCHRPPLLRCSSCAGAGDPAILSTIHERAARLWLLFVRPGSLSALSDGIPVASFETTALAAPGSLSQLMLALLASKPACWSSFCCGSHCFVGVTTCRSFCRPVLLLRGCCRAGFGLMAPSKAARVQPARSALGPS